MDRLDRQRQRQREYRAKKKRERAPGRDDIARELLHFAITENLRYGREEALMRVIDTVTDRLVERGFDRRAAATAFDEIVDRYEAGWAFQRKLHLLR